jgi:hypothetical protein
MKNLSIDDIIEKVRELAKKVPDNKYNRDKNDRPLSGQCSYETGLCTDGSIGCIFGQAALALGLRLVGGIAIDHVFSSRQITTETRLNRKISWCCAVQRYQDTGNTWAKAVEQADVEFSLIED